MSNGSGFTERSRDFYGRVRLIVNLLQQDSRR